MKRIAVLAACAVLAAVSAAAAPHRPAKQYLLSRAQNLRSLGYPPSALVELQRSAAHASRMNLDVGSSGTRVRTQSHLIFSLNPSLTRGWWGSTGSSYRYVMSVFACRIQVRSPFGTPLSNSVDPGTNVCRFGDLRELRRT